jgi:DNA polymerase-1
MNLLVDADILVFRLCWAHEKKIDWGDGIESVQVDEYVAKGRFKKMVKQYAETCGCDSVTMCFTARKNFRYNVYPEYKANRVFERKQLFPILTKWIEGRYHCLRMDFLEADDVMGIMATKEPDKHVIATIDKDLLQIPGRHYNWMHNKKTTQNVLKADRLFYTQIMAGDPTDNYFGIKGVGPAKARKVLDSCQKHERWNAILKLFKSKGYTEEYALQMARVARICRAEDYDFDKKEPILWSPKES